MSIELAWAAGFFDGEGNTNCNISPGQPGNKRGTQNTRRHVTMSVSQKTIATLERFQKAVGIGVIYGPYISQGAPWRWQVSGNANVELVLNKLRPYLTGEKIDQCRYALDRYNSWEPIQKLAVNYTYEQCKHCEFSSRPGPLKRHVIKHHPEEIK